MADPGQAGRVYVLFPNQPNLKGSAVIRTLRAGCLVIFWLPGVTDLTQTTLERAQSALQAWRSAQAEAEAEQGRIQG